MEEEKRLKLVVIDGQGGGVGKSLVAAIKQLAPSQRVIALGTNVQATAAMLRALGGEVEEREDGLLIHGGKPLAGGLVDGAKDHRIVMSAAVAATVCEGEVIITDAQAAAKSFPDFFKIALKA